jgi:uncharacterized protein (TIGR03086 family)
VTWDAVGAYVAGLDYFTAVVARVGPDSWERATGCGNWTARDVVGHVGAATQYGTALLTGRAPTWSPADPPGAAVAGSPAAWWRALLKPARATVLGADPEMIVPTPQGDRRVSEGLGFPAVDLFLHAWDLSSVCPPRPEIPQEAIDFAHAFLDPLGEGMLRGPGVFAPEVRIAPDAGASARFLAWSGRNPATD